jgi:Uncharacterized protein conserved in bacteria (DUF2252)
MIGEKEVHTEKAEAGGVALCRRQDPECLVSDMFLGWTEGREGRHFYVRQLHDMKVKLLVELFTISVMVQYAQYCGWALARAHARAGQLSLIAGYLGKQSSQRPNSFSTEFIVSPFFCQIGNLTTRQRKTPSARIVEASFLGKRMRLA